MRAQTLTIATGGGVDDCATAVSAGLAEVRAAGLGAAKQAYTRWITRVAAYLIDWTPIWVIVLIPFVGLLVAGDMECIDAIYGSGQAYCSAAVSDFWTSIQFIAFLPGAVYFFWNFCYRQGGTGQSVGKSVMQFKVVSEKTWQPISFWLSLVRHMPLRGSTHLLRRISVAAVGRQTSDPRRQDVGHCLRPGERTAAATAVDPHAGAVATLISDD